MRSVLVCLVLALSACGQSTTEVEKARTIGQGPSSCERTASKPLAFTAADATDVVETRSFGANCEDAVVVFTLRSRDGTVLWTYSAPYQALATAEDMSNLQAMDGFLARWANVAVSDTSSAPHWPIDEANPPKEWGPTGQSAFSQLVYERIRADARPSLCVKRTRDSSDCIFYDPEAEAVEVLYRVAP